MSTALLDRHAPAGTLFRLATAGSVDDGKSTLVGRLLHDSKAVLADQLEAVARTSAERGFGGAEGGLDLALLTDGLRAEREQGITIDVAYRYFATDRRTFVLADCPGHVQYTRNTVTGASTADAVVLLVDARKGVVEQTRRHLSVVALLRVPHVIVAVNKIDLVDYAEEVFTAIAEDVRRVARELGLSDAVSVPVSALQGDNVVTRSERTDWYTGPTLMELLESLPGADAEDDAAASFRFPVQLVVRPQGALAPGLDPEVFRDYRGYAGQVVAGTVRPGDAVAVLTPGQPARTTTVVGVDAAGESLEEASSPQSVVLRLADEVDVARGDTIAAADTAPRPRRRWPPRCAGSPPHRCASGSRSSSSTAPPSSGRSSRRWPVGSTSTPCGSTRPRPSGSTTSDRCACTWPRRCPWSPTPCIGAPGRSS